EIAKYFSLPKSMISTILKKKDHLRESYATTSFHHGRKRLRRAAHPEALFIWFKQVRDMNVPISGPILKVKAKELALKLGHFDFM
ncbi:MAG: DNA-binding domain-containing protein, partial [Proteobacteria bacterium]|nr:DNA-binding domain-containing protein [Pseudomonadota bacterium]